MIEAQLTADNDADISAEIDELKQLIEVICQAISDWMTQLNLPESTMAKTEGINVLSAAELKVVVAELVTMLEEADSDAVDKMDEIKGQVVADMWHKMSPALAMINSYQFDDAAELIKSLFEI